MHWITVVVLQSPTTGDAHALRRASRIEFAHDLRGDQIFNRDRIPAKRYRCENRTLTGLC